MDKKTQGTLEMGAAMVIGKKAQGRFVGMWASTGALNAQIEEAYTGHALVKVFNRSAEVEQAYYADLESANSATAGQGSR